MSYLQSYFSYTISNTKLHKSKYFDLSHLLHIDYDDSLSLPHNNSVKKLYENKGLLFPNRFVGNRSFLYRDIIGWQIGGIFN